MEGKTAGVAATGGVQFGTPFGRAHFASAKAPGLLLTDVQMIDALRTPAGKHVLAKARRAVCRAASTASVFGSRRPALVQ